MAPNLSGQIQFHIVCHFIRVVLTGKTVCILMSNRRKTDCILRRVFLSEVSGVMMVDFKSVLTAHQRRMRNEQRRLPV